MGLEKDHLNWSSLPFILLGLLLLYVFIGDLLPRIFSITKAEKIFLAGAFFVALYLTIVFPILLPFLVISRHAHRKISSSDEHISRVKEQVYDLIQETLPERNLEQRDRQLIESILKFKERIVREVMVPRADVFALPYNAPIKDIAKELFEEGYSRIPIYKETLDNVVGVLLYKDFLSLYMTSTLKHDPKLLDQTLDVLMKEPLYTPETTKISHLLQEFLQKQQHLALVVDEFGAIEGIVTIEDLLEEIVGEIEDEYDEEEATLITQQKDSWIVDGKMTLHEINEFTKLRIPQHGDYDTIGGYVVHRAGKIPPIGLKISHDEFDLEVISATERHILKVRIFPRKKMVSNKLSN
ncbi:MAG: hypothetical protein S4CHLAM7_14710 [Chlamydiae bacterium]|nr:hypothetical protein [Chlamydiota bacterium]